MTRITNATCVVEDCESSAHTKGFCRKHFERFRRHGTTIRVRAEDHGYSGSPTYASWTSMRSRCLSPKNVSWKYYGGRGIGIDPRWDNFLTFLADMGPRPEGMTLDRIDSDANYAPENCRWASATTQVITRRRLASNTSGYIGVSWRAVDRRWKACVKVAEKSFVPGKFEDLLEAAWMRDQWALALHGDSATLNFDYFEITL